MAAVARSSSKHRWSRSRADTARLAAAAARRTAAPTAPATGGLYSGSGGPARGGSGGAGTSAPTNGAGYNLNVTDPVTGVTTNTNRGGGGGGAAGKIQVKRRTGDVTGLASPAAAIGDVVIE